MSIIAEALKKAEKESQNAMKQRPVPPPASPVRPLPSGKNAKKNLAGNLKSVVTPLVALSAISLLLMLLVTENAKSLIDFFGGYAPEQETAAAIPEKSADPGVKKSIFLQNTYRGIPVNRNNRPKPTGNELVLRGIMYSGSAPVAVINDEVVKIGEKVGNYVLLAIEENTATVLVNGEKKILPLKR